MTRVLVVALAAMLPALAAAQNHIRCQNTIGGPCGDSSRPREYNCCDYGYCQPWNSGYYQCLNKPERCPNQETDIDYYGNDIRTVVGVQPSQCCDACYDTAGCTAYTFVNENPDGRTRCYLKSASTGRVEKKGAVSAAVNKTSACGAVGSGCGNSGGASCCVDGAYCQPWNGGYYQCLSTPSKCPNQETDIDYYGNDLKTLYNLSPSGCCDTCGSTPGCAAYTFVNENADGRTACYLKSSADGRVAKKGAVSAKNKDFVPSTCPNKLGSQCGNAQTGPGCCPSGTYCQPWNQWYYQCIALPPSEKCTDIKIGVDYYGDDLRVGYNIPPDWCCNNCFLDPECKAYTYVNENENGQSACYMKTGKGETRSNPKAISGSSAPKTA